MAGPVTDSERESFLGKLQVVFVFVVGLSGGLMALRADAGLTGVAFGVGLGILAGFLVAWLAFPEAGAFSRDTDRDRDW